MRLNNLKGKKFGRLVVLRRAQSKRRATYWLCRCICGEEKAIAACHLVSGDIEDCGKIHWELGDRPNGWRGEGEIGYRYFHHIEHGAQIRNIPFAISIRDMWKRFLKQHRKCALSGVPITLERKDGRMIGTASIDRIDSNKGYTPDNVQWIHKDINFMKRNLPEDKFLQHCRNICKHHFSHW